MNRNTSDENWKQEKEYRQQEAYPKQRQNRHQKKLITHQGRRQSTRKKEGGPCGQGGVSKGEEFAVLPLQNNKKDSNYDIIRTGVIPPTELRPRWFVK